MRIVYHLGAHCTDEDRLVRCLLKNRAVLADQGIIVPSPTRYRKLMRDTLAELAGKAATPETKALVLDQIIEETEAERLILSWDGFLAPLVGVMDQGFYAGAGDRVRAFTRIFPENEGEFHLAIRNQVTFLPALHGKAVAQGHEGFLNGTDPGTLRWSAVVQDIMDKNPGMQMTVWCDEETPLIWPEVLQAVSGHAAGTALADTDDILAMIMSDIGLSRMQAYCAEHPPQSVAERRKIVTAFLERFARSERVEMDVDLPDWTQETVEELTKRYFEDVEKIRRIPGVRLVEA